MILCFFFRKMKKNVFPAISPFSEVEKLFENGR